MWGEELARIERELERAKDPLRETRAVQDALANADELRRGIREAGQAETMADVAREMEDARRALDAANVVGEIERYQRPMQELLRNENLGLRVQEAMREYGNHIHALRDAPDVQRSLAEAARMPDSREFRDYTEGIRQASILAEQRLGLDGFTAALRVATSYLEQSQALETAVKRILDGQADQVFNEAARLAASPQVRGLVRRADREAFAGGAGDQAAPGTENAATVDSVGPEGSVALLGSLTKDELLRLRFHTFQMVRVIVVALASAAVFTDNEVDWGTLSSAAGGLIVLIDFIDKALKGHDKEES